MAKQALTPVIEEGVLVGWYGMTFNTAGAATKVFIPRRDEEVEADRAKLDPEHPANWE